MLRIAFCDDETEILEELESLTEQYCADRGCRMEYQAFHSPLELLAAMEKGTYFDAVFLDVLMPGENGISTARELRQTDQNIKIVFFDNVFGVCSGFLLGRCILLPDETIEEGDIFRSAGFAPCCL